MNFDILVGGYEGWLPNIKNTSKFEVVILHFYRAFARTKNTSSSTASHIASVVLFFISPKFPVVPHCCICINVPKILPCCPSLYRSQHGDGVFSPILQQELLKPSKARSRRSLERSEQQEMGGAGASSFH